MMVMLKSSVLFFLCSLSFLLSIFVISSAVDTISTARSIRDGGGTLVSTGGRFEVGFFSPGSSQKRYLGIWYSKISPLTVVWVANRETPLLDSSGVLRITSNGSLVLLNRTNGVAWSSSSSRPVHSPIAQLLESGNFVVREGNSDDPESFVWQSFDHPGDTLLPGMKLGVNRISGQKWSLTSWKEVDDPSPGDYGLAVDPNRYSQLVLTKNSVIQSLSGPWNGEGYNGEPGLKANSLVKFEFVFNQTDIFYTCQVRHSSVISRLLLNPAGMLQRFIWFSDSRGWVLFTTVVMGNCHRYGLCGPYGNCDINGFQACGCLKGFEPKSPKDWNTGDWSRGCVRKTRWDCGRGDGFRMYSGIKLPDTLHYWYNGSMSLEECRMMCLRNCSCTAYANPYVTVGNRCLLWFGDLVDIRMTADNPQDIYIKMAASEQDADHGLNSNANSHEKKRVKTIAIAVAASGVVLLVIPLTFYVCWKKQRQQGDGPDKEDLQLPFYDWDTIAIATDNFSFHNILGEGGFGPVYKGFLKDGQEIAVKRLSRSSKQGIDEFKNEVVHIAKLQHRNLVRLLGYCIKQDEKLLVYEHVPNKGLDAIIFDRNKSTVLDWSKRFCIINGVARGLLYLHQDSRLRIIHRDLKASNVLLDKEMNPKISDFGMARSFGGNETEGNTRRVVGTYGYMSPEYAIDGIYSVKSDVFSFGVLLLEIISGMRNRGFHHPKHNLNLIGHAWKSFMEDRPLELIDESIRNSHSPSELLRSIHVGLLCVQRRPEDRPTMSFVVLMLSGDGALPQPKQPGFFNERDPFETDSSTSQAERGFVSNDFSITSLNPR